MKCPTCGKESFVVETRPRPNGSTVRRRRACPCGARWTTDETVASTVASKKRLWKIGPENATRSVSQTPPLVFADATPSVSAPPKPPPETLPLAFPNTTGSVRGVGGVLSPVRSGSALSELLPVLGADPDLSLDPVQGVDPARAKPRRKRTPNAVVPQAFADFWENITSTRSKGLRAEALTEWEIVGRPGAAVLIPKWEDYVEVSGAFPVDVCRWLKARGWEDNYRPASQVSNATRQTFDVTRRWAAAKAAEEATNGKR